MKGKVTDEQQLLTMNELTQELKRSRVTIHKYINQGMPVIKKGRINFFNLHEVKAWLGQKVGDEYAELMGEAKVNYPNNPLKQIEYLNENASRKTFAIGMAEIAKEAFDHSNMQEQNLNISLDLKACNYFFRGLLFALRHIQDESAFLYIGNRMTNFIVDITRQRYPDKYEKKIFQTFLGQTEETLEEFEKKEYDVEKDYITNNLVDF